MPDISKRFADIRAVKKLNKKRFADSLGISQSVSGDIELGKREPSRNVLIQLAKIHKVNINWLLTGEGVMFLPELRQDDEISISGIGNVGNRGGVRHFTVLPSELLPAEDNVENQEALKMYKILLLTKEQVLL